MDSEHFNAEGFARQRAIAALEAEITELAGHLNAANYRFLKLIAEFDRCQGWGGDGATHSCAHWLNCYVPSLTMSGNERASAPVIGNHRSHREEPYPIPDIVLPELKTVKKAQ